jgi:hypothetical protein
MLHRASKFVLVVLAGITVALLGQAVSQQASQPANGRGNRGNFDPAAAQARRDQAIKDALGITDDAEFKVLQPKLEAVQTLSRQVRAGGMGMMGRMGGNRPGRGGANPPADAPQLSDVEKKAQELSTLLQNKDAKPEDIKAALAAYRDARTKAKAELEKAQKDLRDLLTVRQEAVLVSMGTLD